MDSRFFAVFLILCGCGTKVVTVTPVAVADGKVAEKPVAIPEPAGSAIAPVTEIEIADDPSSRTETQ
jgi:hypothetical protein